MSDSGRSERIGSIASSCTEVGGLEEHNEKLAQILDDESLSDIKSAATAYQESDHGREDEELLPQQLVKEDPPKSSLASSIIWMVVNTFATIGIVSIYPQQPSSFTYSLIYPSVRNYHQIGLSS
jgi:solute carrier family 35 protein E3